MERFTVVAASSSSNGNSSSGSSLSQRPIMFKESSLPSYNTTTISSFPPPKPHQFRDSSKSTFSSSSSSYKQQQQPPVKPIPPIQDRLSCRVVDDSAEISIFEAEKYFNETQDHQKGNKKQSPSSSCSVTVGLNLDPRIVLVDRCEIPASSSIPRLSSVSSIDGYGRNYRTGSFHATPTASSEASWNSQSGLLSNPPGSIAVSMRNVRLDGAEKRKGSSSLNSSSSSNKWFFGRKCPCSGKKSVQVEEKFSEPKTQPVLHLNSSSLNHRKQNSSDAAGGGGGGGDQFSVLSSSCSSIKAPPLPIRNSTEKVSKEFDRGIDEMIPKLKPVSTISTNWAKETHESVAAVKDSGGFLPENLIPVGVGRRVAPSGRSFSDNGGGGSGGAFSFPILNPPQVATKLILNCPMKSPSQLEDPPRESLEVFRPTEESSLRKSTDLQRRGLMTFPEDNDRRSFTFPASPKTRTTPMEDDVVSDASSDLFEIESFSTQTTMYPMYRRKDSLDEISSFESKRYGGLGGGILNFRRSLDETTTTASIAATEFYEPSEASIDWSVTTAEGFERGSITNFSIAAASDYEENRYMMNMDSSRKVTVSNGSTSNNANGSSTKRKGGNGLLSCRCEKAVSVGPHPVKCVPEQQQRHNHHVGGAPFGIESGRINPGMSKLSDISSMHVTRASAGTNVPLARSHSARMSHALTTH